MLGRRRPNRAGRMAAICALLLASGVFAIVNDAPAYGDAHAPPPFPANCPEGQAPPPGYPNPPPSAAAPFIYTGPSEPDWSLVSGRAYSGPIPYEVPFKSIIFGGSIELPPYVKVPDLYASLCGLVQLPSLAGTIAGSNFNVATPNIYIAGLEALPAKVTFKNGLHATIEPTPAANGGLDIAISGPTTTSVSTLGMTCSITLDAKFTTMTDGALRGAPVTGPTEAGQAEVVSNSFPVPAVVGSNSGLCPPSIAQTFNNLLGLPARAGLGTFVAPFCFDFELEGPNNPEQAPVANKNCPWPAS